MANPIPINDFAHNGIEIHTTEPAPSIGPLSDAVVCLVGIAPDKHESINYNEPVRINNMSHATALLDPQGLGQSTLLPAFVFLLQKVKPVCYAVVVEADTDMGVTMTNIIGGIDAATGQRTGIAAVSSAQERPTIIAAPGFHSLLVGQALSAQAKALYAIPVIDGPNTTSQAAAEFAADFGAADGEDKLVVCDPWAQTVIKGVEITLPASVMGVACLAAVNAWESPQNQGVQISELSRPIGYAINDASSEHNFLNKHGVTTFAHTRLGGFSLIGNRTNTGRFISHVGLENALARKLEETSQQHMGQNLTKQFIDSVVSRLNNWLQSLVAQGAIPAANVYLHPDKNNLENYNSGRWYLVLDYGRYAPNEHMVYGLSVNNELIEQFIEELN